MEVRGRLLDLGCGAGGASYGYHLAGWDVTGADLHPQPNYPFRFIQADMMTVDLDGYDAYHASAPCQDHSPLSALVGQHGTGWMLGAIRERLAVTGKPYVLENVPGAPMRRDLWLCGKMFRLRVKRHRLFEIGNWWGLISQPAHPRHDVPTATRQRRQRWAEGWDVSITGDVGVYLAPEAMGVDWMTGNELSQAVPPAYTRYVGETLRSESG
jgi:DNA (cytosine-5)-methyltransferase 1